MGRGDGGCGRAASAATSRQSACFAAAGVAREGVALKRACTLEAGDARLRMGGWGGQIIRTSSDCPQAVMTAAESALPSSWTMPQHAPGHRPCVVEAGRRGGGGGTHRPCVAWHSLLADGLWDSATMARREGGGATTVAGRNRLGSGFTGRWPPPPLPSPALAASTTAAARPSPTSSRAPPPPPGGGRPRLGVSQGNDLQRYVVPRVLAPRSSHLWGTRAPPPPVQWRRRRQHQRRRQGPRRGGATPPSEAAASAAGAAAAANDAAGGNDGTRALRGGRACRARQQHGAGPTGPSHRPGGGGGDRHASGGRPHRAVAAPQPDAARATLARLAAEAAAAAAQAAEAVEAEGEGGRGKRRRAFASVLEEEEGVTSLWAIGAAATTPVWYRQKNRRGAGGVSGGGGRPQPPEPSMCG